MGKSRTLKVKVLFELNDPEMITMITGKCCIVPYTEETFSSGVPDFYNNKT